MCLILFGLNAHPDYRLVLAANRDEFYDRPAEPARFWDDAPFLLAGRDLKASGTWMGVTTGGRFAALTNYRDPSAVNPAAPSRGALAADYLLADDPPENYLKRLRDKAHRYNGFNLLAGDASSVYCFSSRSGEIAAVVSGVHGLSNRFLDTPWPKVSIGKERLAGALKRKFPSPEALFALLSDETRHPDHLLPETGVGIEWERVLSAIRIRSPIYGTRSQTALFIGRDGRVLFSERTLDPGGNAPETRTYRFIISDA